MTAPSAVKCQVTATASPASFGPGGGSGSVNISTERDCTWSASADAPWIAFTGSTTGQGTAALPYKVSANGAPTSRRGTIAVADAQIQVAQDPAPCRYSLSGNAAHAGPDATTVSIAVDAVAGCGWTATSQASWLAPRPASGSGAATIQVQVAANSGGARAGQIAIADQTFAVAQDAAPAATPPPTPPPTPTPTPTPAPAPTPSPAPNPSPVPPPPPAPTPTPAPPPTPAPTPTPTPTPAPSPGAAVQLSGTVFGLAGACPAITFHLDNAFVVASPQTDYRKGNCKKIQDGDRLSVAGHTAPDGTVAADTITIGGN